MKRRMFGLSDSEADHHEFIICHNGSLTEKFRMSINCEEEEVDDVKWRLLKKLSLLDKQAGSSVNP